MQEPPRFHWKNNKLATHLTSPLHSNKKQGNTLPPLKVAGHFPVFYTEIM